MIDDVTTEKDKAGYPIVTWFETRGFGQREKIECRIMKTNTGELTFVARGHVRLGQFEEGRPWQMLQGFAIKPAAELYQGQAEQALHKHFESKSPVLGALLRDGGRVIVAAFRPGVPIHINEVDAPLGVVERLHAVLVQEFVHGTQQALNAGWRCAPDDLRVETFDPERSGWSDEPAPRPKTARIMAGLVNTGVAALALGMTALLVYLVLLLVGVVRP